MNSAENEIDRMLKEMEDEVTNLKTAHQRPLGALSFFRESVTIPVNMSYAYGAYYANIKIVVKVATPTTKPPIVQAGWDVPSGFNTVWFYGVTVDSDYATWTYDITLDSLTISSTSIAVGAISSQPIESLTWSIT